MSRYERDARELIAANTFSRRHTCLGLDTNIEVVRSLVDKGLKLPTTKSHLSPGEMVVAYNKMALEAVEDVGYIKPNLAFYRRLGHECTRALAQTVELAKVIHRKAVVILDAKYGDIDSTNDHYVWEVFDFYGADAVTVHNYMGKTAMTPFLSRKDKVSFVLAKTSSKDSDEFQGIKLAKEADAPAEGPDILLYQRVTRNVVQEWNEYGNCGLVAGATYAAEAKVVRDIAGSSVPVLIPGVGAQGAKISDIGPVAVRRGDAAGINSSRGWLFATPQEGETQAEAIRRVGNTMTREILEAQDKVA